MIYDSIIWKKELKQIINNFDRLVKRTNFSLDWLFEEDKNGYTGSYKFLIKFQKFCFYASVITRKFIESKRLSDEIITKQYSIKVHKRKNISILTKENFESIEEEYDINNVAIENLELVKICHLFIHSFIFIPKFQESKIDNNLSDDDIENWEVNGISGLYINTDFSKEKKIYFFDLEQIINLFKEVSEDDVVFISHDKETGTIIRSKIVR